MNFLGIFKKIVDVTDKATPAITIVNPAAGMLVSSILQGIIAVQSILPGSEHNEVKKSVVTDIANAAQSSAGVTLTPAQTSALIENLLAALKASAAVPAAPIEVAQVPKK